MPVWDVHRERADPFGATEFLDYRAAQLPPDDGEALHHRNVMRKPRSTQKRQRLLTELEQRYRNGP